MIENTLCLQIIITIFHRNFSVTISLTRNNSIVIGHSDEYTQNTQKLGTDLLSLESGPFYK